MAAIIARERGGSALVVKSVTEVSREANAIP